MIKPNVIVGLVFVFLVIVLSYLSYKGRLKNTWLEKADKISRIISMGIAVVAFLNPFPDHPLKPEQSISLDNNNQNINIGQSNSGNVTIGDTSTSAKQRAEVAVAQVKQELVKNFNTLAVLINTIENQPPTKFLDIRRANEFELAYQDRATNEFRDYQKLVGDLIKLNNFSRALYLSFQRELSYNSNIAERIKKTYEYQEEVRDSFARFESGLQHNLSLRLSNSERTARSISLHQEKIANAKMNLALSIADFCLLSNPNDVKLVSDSLAIALPVPAETKIYLPLQPRHRPHKPY